MDFKFDTYFQNQDAFYETEIELNEKLQNARHALQESLSENDSLSRLVETLYKEARIENVSITELLGEIPKPIFRNMPLPRNADDLPTSEKAGYVVYYMKYLGHMTRKLAEQYNTTKVDLDSMNKSIREKTIPVEVKRTGEIKVPELDGVKEIKRNNKIETPPSPPATPPEEKDKLPHRSRERNGK